jgi:hypothetical protein
LIDAKRLLPTFLWKEIPSFNRRRRQQMTPKITVDQKKRKKKKEEREKSSQMTPNACRRSRHFEQNQGLDIPHPTSFK